MWDKIQTNLGEVWDQLGYWVSDHIINILVIVVGAWLVRHFSSKFIGGLLKHTVRSDLYPTKVDRDKRIKTLNSLVSAAMRLAVYVVATILIIGEINPSYTTALFASAGLIGVAIGFGAKDVINDFMSGIFIIIENQYRVGDVVKLSEVSGVVEDITIRTTVLRDLDGNVHHVPNGSIGVTTNMTLDYSQINEDIVVGYDCDLKQVEHVINHVGEEIAASPEFKNAISEPPHVLRVDGFSENGIIIKITGRTTGGDQWDVKGELYKRLKTAFEKHQIEIPYQHVVVHQAKKN